MKYLFLTSSFASLWGAGFTFLQGLATLSERLFLLSPALLMAAVALFLGLLYWMKREETILLKKRVKEIEDFVDYN